MVLNRGAFGKALWPGVKSWTGKGYSELTLEHPSLFDTYRSDKAFEEDVSVSGFGLWSTGSEASQVIYDSMSQGFVTRYNHVKYFSGFIITSDLIDDNQYMGVIENKATALGFGARQTQETVAANVYNRAFNNSFLGGDGKELLSTSHPNIAGGTYSNKLAVDADLSEAALEQAVIDLMKFTNDRGLRISVMVKSLIIPVDLWAEVCRVLRSPLQADAVTNNINALKLEGKIPEVILNHYLTDTDAWFLRTNIPDGMKRYVRKDITFSEDNEFESDNLKYKGVYRESYGWSDARALYGSQGA